jgi:predicted permease
MASNHRPDSERDRGPDGQPPEPPRFAARLLERLLPPTDRGASILGDLQEEFEARAALDERSARRWYAVEAVGIGLRYWKQSRRYRRGAVDLGDRNHHTGSWEGILDAFFMNVRYAIRRLTKSPMFTLVAVLSLGLGIGANTAIFSLVNAAILRDSPYTNPEELVDVFEAQEGFSHGTLSYPDYKDFEEGTKDVFAAVGGMQIALVQADTEDGVEMLFAESVTGNYFTILGIEAARGRLISEEDHVARGAHPVVALSHNYWVSRYGQDPDIVGQEVRLGGRQYTVIGIAPEGFAGTLRGLEPSIFISIAMTDEIQGSGSNTWELRGNQSFFGKARLLPGATVAQAEAVADRVSTRLREEYPRFWGPQKAFVLVKTDDVIMNPMIDRVLVPAAGMIMGVVGLVLLIACANLASFLLARAADRRKEIAVRLAMGAKRRTLIGQLMTETVILAGLGGALGIFIAVQALDFLVGADLPLPFPITLDLSLDTTVLSFSLAVSLLAGLLFGMAPALQSTNPDVAPTLRDETAGGGRARGALLRNMLVVGQVAVSVVLLVGAGLFLRSLDASRSIDPGFGGAPAGMVQLVMPSERYSEEERKVYLNEVRDRIAALPGVESVGMIDLIHMEQLNTQTIRVVVDGVENPPGRDFHSVDYAEIDEHFLEAGGVDLVTGRGFGPDDRADSEEVALVSEEFVRRFFPEGGAVGRTIVINDDPVQVVGVTTDHKVRQLGEPTRPFVYINHLQSPSNYMWVVARTAGDDDRLVLDMIAEARALDPEIIVAAAKTMERHLAVVLLGRELGAMVVGGFALLALLLASIGLYGVVSYAVARRAKEVGIRLSLGADNGSVIRMLTGSGMKLVAVGGAVGLLLAAAASQLLSRLLYGVPPLDAATFVTVPVVLGIVAFLASWVPARRVTRIDPVGALRSE